jgi:hypothetical protein
MPGFEEPLQYSYTGFRYLLGYGQDYYGIWDRQAPTVPVKKFPRTDEGWSQAWREYAALEPNGAPVTGQAGWGDTGAQQYYQQYGQPGAGPYAQPYAGQHYPVPQAAPVSGWWWVAPILFGFIGGLIAWGVNKGRDAAKARSMLFVGLAISAVNVLLYLSSGGRFPGH